MDCIIGLVGVLAAFVLGKFLAPIQITIKHEGPETSAEDLESLRQMSEELEKTYEQRGNEVEDIDQILGLLHEFQNPTGGTEDARS